MAKIPNISWSKVLGELVLIFVAINLSIWFNNWNQNRQADQRQAEAADNLKQELSANLEDLLKADSVNRYVPEACHAYERWYVGSSDWVLATPATKDSLGEVYPGFFRVADSVAKDAGKFLYKGTTYIELELPTLSQVAWGTTVRFSQVTQGFSFDCLYALESAYALQERLLLQLDQATASLQAGDFDALVIQLEVAGQYSRQLTERYQEALTALEVCAN